MADEEQHLLKCQSYQIPAPHSSTSLANSGSRKTSNNLFSGFQAWFSDHWQKLSDPKMAGGVFAVEASPTAAGSGGKITVAVFFTCLMAATGGLIFGYDIGISGGVTTMESFLKKFFPSVFRNMASAKQNVYCVYDSQLLTSFTSSLYIAGLVASLGAGKVTRAMGRRASMLLGGCTFLAGAAINGVAVNIVMLILGRILLGFGVGFTNQATPVYLSEMAPPKWRGAFNSGFQFFIGIGVVTANLINYGTARIHTWGWRLSLGLAAVPALIMTVAALFLPDTPSSLIQRGHTELAKETLRRARGSSADLDAEFEEFARACQASKVVTSPYQMILRRRYRPHLVMSVAIPFFQQMTGINVIAFYSPILFQTVGFGKDSSLMAAVILGLVNLASILVSTYVVDRYGRRILFLAGGAQMIICQNIFLLFLLMVPTKQGSSGMRASSKDWSLRRHATHKG
ncbi:sugar transport protein 5 isoform X2 [Amborella trichopoda]|uniref:sugar transport protein 5 isoform X2 n=1 Tax=Amborella trichopoda TaxID=13333 RepID=UPI0009C06AA7|nr:sugar transport protein 5 isoform X2 [Amborella trichopoda]|eukprot:XP_011626512.2 sugar transport protein 5 isoform X2 [Amborella trichopoda]